ncbi:MAG: hypothetical protein J7647_26135 [Cyanobacteria bacterium SBLK]|nr:hypothetical protein [Cyanobacteria bacterium SBLK]
MTRIEQTDAAIGGNETNPPNLQNKQLADRDKWLHDALAVLGITPTSTTEEIREVLAGDADAAATQATTLELGAASIAQGRLTLASGKPVPSNDIIAASTLYYTPYNGDLIAIYNTAQSRWEVKSFVERSLDISGLLADTNYDIFLYTNAGALTLEAVAWANSGAGTSARAKSISRLNGIYVKTSDNRRYLGTIRTTSTLGECEFSSQKRFVWNAKNRYRFRLLNNFPFNSHTYSGTAWRKVRNLDSYTLHVVCGLPEFTRVSVKHNAYGDTNVEYFCGIGINSSTVNLADLTDDPLKGNPGDGRTVTADFLNFLDAGYHQIIPLEATGGGGGVATFFGAAGSPALTKLGIIGDLEL